MAICRGRVTALSDEMTSGAATIIGAETGVSIGGVSNHGEDGGESTDGEGGQRSNDGKPAGGAGEGATETAFNGGATREERGATESESGWVELVNGTARRGMKGGAVVSLSESESDASRTKCSGAGGDRVRFLESRLDSLE